MPFIWPVHSRVFRGRPGGRGISAIPACTPVTASPHAAAFGPTSLQHSLRHVCLRFTRTCACGLPSGKPRSRSLLSSYVRAVTTTQRPAHPTVQLLCACCCPHVPVRHHRLVPSPSCAFAAYASFAACRSAATRTHPTTKESWILPRFRRHSTTIPPSAIDPVTSLTRLCYMGS